MAFKMLRNAHVPGEPTQPFRSSTVLASAGAGLAEMGGLRDALPQETVFTEQSDHKAKGSCNRCRGLRLRIPACERLWW